MPKDVIFDKQNILIVGGAGFVGSHLAEELVTANKVICIDNFLTGDEGNISHLYQNPNFEFINHNIIETIELEQQPELSSFKVDFQGIQEIYFLGSPTSPNTYRQHPIETMLANSIGLSNALDLAVKYKAKFLYASSPAVYGDAQSEDLVKEDYVGAVDQLASRSAYVEAKRFGEALVSNYRQIHNLDAKIIRIFNCYGPKMKLDDGRMIPEMIRDALLKKDITIFGDKDSAGCYFYISDLIKAMIKMMESVEVGPINIGSDWQTKFSEVAEKVISITGTKSKIKYKKPDSFMAPQLTPDISLAKEKLDWFPIVLLNEGLHQTIDYLSAQKDVLRPGKNK